MARGWESKGVESQMADAAEERASGAREPLSTEERGRKSEAAQLMLARNRVAKDLEGNQHPRRRAELEAALKHLDAKLRLASSC